MTHVDDDAAPGGVGTWEKPFSRLEAASLSGTDIVLVQNGTYVSDFIALSAGQRLLAANLPHFVDTKELGTIVLPGTGTGGASTILNSPFDAITVASATEVAGFQIAGAANNGIYGSGAGHVLIRSNTISQSGRDGIMLLELFGTGEFDSNQLVQNRGNGLLVTAGDVELQLAENIARENALSGIKVVSDALAGDIFGNLASENGLGGIDLRVENSMRGTIRGNTAMANGHAGINVAVPDLTGSVLDNVASRNGTRGIDLNTQMTGDISGNTVSENGSDGIRLLGRLLGSIRNNVANGNGTSDPGAGGIHLGTGGVTGDIAGNVANENGGSGIRLQTFDVSRSVGGNVINNVANNNRMFGIDIFDLGLGAAGGVGGSVAGNTANGNMQAGIQITGGIGSRIDGSISHNTADGNGTHPGVPSGAGILVRTGQGIGGDVIGNQANGNRDSGILIDVFASGTDFTGSVSSNVTNDNADGFVFAVPGDFIGDFTGNTANLNDRYGFNTFAGGTVSGTTTGNLASGNGLADFNGNIAQP